MKRIYTLLLFVMFGFIYTAQSQIALSEGFEAGIPADWTIETLATDGGWVGTSVSDASSGAWALPDHGGGGVVSTNDDACNCDKSNDWLITPAISLAGMTAPTLSFDRAFGGFAYQAVTESGSVSISIDGGTTWTELSALDGQGTLAGAAGTPDWVNESIDLSAYAGVAEVWIGFKYSDNDGWLYAMALDNVLVFQPLDWEIELSKLSIAPVHVGDVAVNITGEVKNLGINNVTSFDLAWTDGTNNYSETVSGVDIAPFSTYAFTASDAFTTVAASTSDITVTISSPNGNADGDASNNELFSSVTGVAFIPDRKVVVEEATGTWCGWCPRGTVGLEYMTATYPNTFIGIAVHNGDPMTVTEYDSNMGVGGYPSSNFDRFYTDTDPNSNNLEMLHNLRLMEISPAAISDVVTYNPDTREITIELSAEFVAPVNGDYRFNAVIVEDSVTGTSSGFAQANYYSGGNDLFSLDGTNWADLAATVPAADMVYDHVGRALLGGYFGEVGSMPAAIAAGDTPGHTFTYTLPADMDENHIHVVSMILDADNDDIINATSTDVEIPVGNKNLNFNENLAKVFPNPFSDMTTVSLNLVDAADVTIQVYNSVGQMVGQQDFGKLSGEQNIPFNGTNLSEGVYIMHIVVGEQVVTKRLTIAK